MKCKKCGNDILEGEKFCGKCGTKVEVEEKTVTANEAEQTRKKEKKIKSVETEITNLISFNKKRQAYA